MDIEQGGTGLYRPKRRIQLLPGSKRGIESIWADYNQIDPTDSLDERKAKLEQWIAKRVGTKLTKAYPNREWKVVVDISGQILIVACDSISNYKGYHIHMANRTILELETRAVAAAGEILERHNVTRSKKFDTDLIETWARDARDNVIAADSAPEPIKA